jgi:hypothetical protein
MRPAHKSCVTNHRLDARPRDRGSTHVIRLGRLERGRHRPGRTRNPPPPYFLVFYGFFASLLLYPFFYPQCDACLGVAPNAWLPHPERLHNGH